MTMSAALPRRRRRSSSSTQRYVLGVCVFDVTICKLACAKYTLPSESWQACSTAGSPPTPQAGGSYKAARVAQLVSGEVIVRPPPGTPPGTLTSPGALHASGSWSPTGECGLPLSCCILR